MVCWRGHPVEPRAQIVPGFYQCQTVEWVPMPSPYGPAVPQPVPCNQTYYDASAGPIATCGNCGKYAFSTCPRCGQFRCAECWNMADAVCTGCAAAYHQWIAADRQRRLAGAAATPDLIERLLQAAMIFEGASGEHVYPAIHAICPFLHYEDWMVCWDPMAAPGETDGPEPVPWYSGPIAAWFVAHAGARGIGPDFTFTEGKMFGKKIAAWRFPHGSNVLYQGQASTAYVLLDGTVVRADERDMDRTGGLVVGRTDPTELNLRALARLGRILNLRDFMAH